MQRENFKSRTGFLLVSAGCAMKLTNVNFLAKANAKINKNEKGIKIISALLVISKP